MIQRQVADIADAAADMVVGDGRVADGEVGAAGRDDARAVNAVAAGDYQPVERGCHRADIEHAGIAGAVGIDRDVGRTVAVDVALDADIGRQDEFAIG